MSIGLQTDKIYGAIVTLTRMGALYHVVPRRRFKFSNLRAREGPDIFLLLEVVQVSRTQTLDIRALLLCRRLLLAMDWLSPTLSDALSRRVQKLPLGIISVEQDDVEEEDHHDHHPRHRRLGLADRDPTGFLVRFQGCSVEDDSKVVLEVCPTYHPGGLFGGACLPYLTDYFEWVKFHHNTIILRMLHDFCTVCDDVCPPDVYREIQKANTDALQSFPDICNSVYVYNLNPIEDEESCDLICQAHHEKHAAVLESCSNTIDWGDHKSCSANSDYRRRWLDEDLEETCVLDMWWMEWTDSCDMPGYPTMADELTDPHGNAFLQCSFKDDDPAHCRDFYYEQITSCQDREKDWHRDTPAPTSVDCQTHDSSPQASTPTQRPTAAPKIYTVENVVEKEENTIVSSPSPTRGVTKYVPSPSPTSGVTNTVGFAAAGCLVFACLLALLSWHNKRRHRQNSPHWNSVPQVDLELREQQDEPLYHQAIEMNSKN